MQALTRVAAVLAVASSLLVATPAHAEKNVHADGVGDVWVQTEDMVTGETTTPVPSRKRANVDVAKTVVRHGSQLIRVSVDYDTLRKKGRGFVFSIRLKDNQNEYDTRAWVVADPDAWDGNLTIYRRSRELDCGTGHAIDYAEDTLTMTIPRDCLLAPRWVRYSSWAHRYMWEPQSTTARFFSDDPRGDQWRPRRVAFSSRIYSG